MLRLDDSRVFIFPFFVWFFFLCCLLVSFLSLFVLLLYICFLFVCDYCLFVLFSLLSCSVCLLSLFVDVSFSWSKVVYIAKKKHILVDKSAKGPVDERACFRLSNKLTPAFDSH